ncbi:MAG: outer membrane protein assembly factor BamA [Phycisphaerales bacterium]|nr:outer membrane protein assembly factor BamA [Phycisphaerales bacterium]
MEVIIAGYRGARQKCASAAILHPMEREQQRHNDKRAQAAASLRPQRTRANALLLALALTSAPLLLAPHAHAQSVVQIDDETLADRPVSKVVFKGLVRVREQEVINNVRVAAGQPFEANSVRSDVGNLYRLGQFETVGATATLMPDGTVEVHITFVEQAIILDLQFVGNKILSDQELRKSVSLYAGGPRDDFLLEQSMKKIKDLYRKRGNYLAEVTVDETRLKDSGILIIRIVEGPRVKIKEIEFIGNASFDARELNAEVRTRGSIPLFVKGELDEEMLIDDVAALDKFYKDRGFVDVRADRRVSLSADNTEAKVAFIIDEGRQYRLRSLVVEGRGAEGPRPLGVFSEEQLRDLGALRTGDVFSRLKIDKTIALIRDAYLLMGHIDVLVTDRYVRTGEDPEVDLIINVTEGSRVVTGVVLVQGNFLTRDRVIRRLVRIQPGRVLDGRELTLSRERVQASQLFNNVRVTVQRARPEDQVIAQDEIDEGGVRTEVRDLLVEIKEKNTGAVNFGVGMGTDSGVFGEFSINQKNFDIQDHPLTFEEFVAGRAYRGAGQQFAISIAPGNEVSTVSLDFTEPHLMESDVALRINPYFRERIYEDWNEARAALGGSLSRRLGDFWSGGMRTNLQWIELTDFDVDTPDQVLADAGPETWFSIGPYISFLDTDNQFRPSRGTKFELALSQFQEVSGGGGFSVVKAGFTNFYTLSEDFLGRKTTLRVNGDVGYILGGEAPTYEKFYLGGRSFRGFQFRTVSPKGTIGGLPDPDNDGVGGNWMAFLGTQVEQPIFGASFSGVAFIDSGTVTDEVEFSPWRVSVGFGVRLYIPQFGPAPLAFDFAVPIVKDPTDETQVFSFSAEIPF